MTDSNRTGPVFRATWIAAVVGALAACAQPTPPPEAAAAKAASAAPAATGPVRMQDDAFLAVNGEWLAKTEIPEDRAAWGTSSILRDEAQAHVATLLDAARANAGTASVDEKKLATLYGDFLDEARAERLGAKPIAADLRAIDAMKSKAAIPAMIASLNRRGVTAPYFVDIGVDKGDPTRYVPTIYQSGLGMPDRDYYLKDDDAKLKDTRDKYVAHVAAMFVLAGVKDPDASAAAVLDIETRLARAQWTRVENRNPVKTYNRVALRALDASTPGYAWKTWLADAGLVGRVDTVVVAQPTYLRGFAETVEAVPLSAWKAYFKYRVVSAASPYLSKAFVDESFAFNGGVLAGTPTQLPRWKRGVALCEASMGEAIGRLYVAKYFPPTAKAKMDTLVRNLLEAYRQSIDGLDWMGPETKKEAQAKLARFTPKIGYPSKWRDYAPLKLEPGDVVGNLWRARRFEYDHDLAHLGHPIDKTEWGMTPQTVNAYYSPTRNEIVFPAAILQPPVFDAAGDDAANYGAIGAVIGHEISHGFDDSGSQYDGEGRLRNWWTDDDRARFTAKAKAMVAQYAAYEPVPGYHINGELTLGENIADNAGLSIALKAYHLSLQGRPAPVIDGLTGDQRFYRAFEIWWRAKLRDAFAIRLIKSDTHAINSVRGNATLRNQPGFYAAFDVQPGDRMYLPPDQRVLFW